MPNPLDFNPAELDLGDAFQETPPTPPTPPATPPAPAEPPANPPAPPAPPAPADPFSEPGTPPPTPPADPFAEPPAGNPGNPADPTEDPLPLVVEISQRLSAIGIDFGQDEFDDSVDGIVDLVTKGSSKLAEYELSELRKTSPKLAEMYEFVRQGGSEQAFLESLSAQRTWSEIKIGDDDVSTAKQVLGSYLKANGHSPEETSEIISEYEASGILVNQGRRALKVLEAKEAESRQAMLASQQAAAAEAQRQYDLFVADVRKTVAQPSVKGVPVPVSERNELVDYMFKDTGNGYSRFDERIGKMTAEERTLIAYILMKEFDIEKISKPIVARQAASSLRSRVGSAHGAGTPPPSQGKQENPVDPKAWDV